MNLETKTSSPEQDDLAFSDSPKRISGDPPANSTKPPQINEDDDFEFAFEVSNSKSHPSISADEIFFDGQIRPIYPVFNRDLLLSDDDKLCRQPLLQLLMEDRNASISKSCSEDDLRGIPPESYCVWKPGGGDSPATVRKSSSTGSPRRRRFRDLVIGRSCSDGKEKFMFFAAEEKSGIEKEVGLSEGKKKGKEKKVTEMDLMSAHRMFYGLNGNGSTQRTGPIAGGRKSFLPYKPEIVGFFARVNGIGRTHHPF